MNDRYPVYPFQFLVELNIHVSVSMEEMTTGVFIQFFIEDLSI